MKFDIEGRIRNMRLPDGRTALIYSIYEAVINGVHAIEERFGEADAILKGAVQILIEEDDKKVIESISIRDNGIGLDDGVFGKPTFGVIVNSRHKFFYRLLVGSGLGFRREGTNDPVVIIEFKRPGDEHLSSDPIDQVLGYIEKLQQRTVRGVDGEVITEIGPQTPFECIVICDLTEAAKKKFQRSVAQHPTPDGMGFYGFSTPHRASIRVISYQKLFRDAQLRNQSFFDHLGLLPEEVRKAMSESARVDQTQLGNATLPAHAQAAP